MIEAEETEGPEDGKGSDSHNEHQNDKGIERIEIKKVLRNMFEC